MSFQIPMSPMSLNQSHRLVKFGGKSGRIKTEKFIKWEKEFNVHLSYFNDQKIVMLDYYSKYKHAIKLEMFVYINEKKFFTRPKNKKESKTINKRSGDSSNMIKTSEDQIFNWLGIDDSQVCNIETWKIPTNDEGVMVFRVSIINFPEMLLVEADHLSNLS